MSGGRHRNRVSYAAPSLRFDRDMFRDASVDVLSGRGVNTTPPDLFGGAVAQLGERLTGSQEVDGSIPFSSTIFSASLKLPL